MKRTIFTGAGVALVTPMHPDGSINWSKLDELIEFQISGGTDAIIACGTTGESACLNHEEHVEVIRHTVERVNHRIPVVAGAGSNDTAYAQKMLRQAAEVGADAALVVTPYYNKTSQLGLIRHYNLLADTTDLPMIVYNVPSRTGVNILPSTYAELAKHPNIVAIKEANGSISAVAETMSLCGDALTVYSGNDDQIVPIMSLGGKGVISVLSNVAPAQTHELAVACLNGDFAKGAAMQLDFCDLVKALFSDVNPVPVKEALNLMGMGVGECRLPLVSMPQDKVDALRAVMEKHNLI